MIIISHRGNIIGVDRETENNPEQITAVLNRGFEVEVDVWFRDDKLWLGHDGGEYEINIEFLQHPRIWVHAKNKEVVPILKRTRGIHWFWHENDTMTLTSYNYIWCFPGQEIDGCIMVDHGQVIPDGINIAGVCTDNPMRWKNIHDAKQEQ